MELTKKNRQTIRDAMKFNIDDVMERYQKKHGLKKRILRLHEREIKRFLLVCALNNTGKSIGMRGKVDELWHEFIIFTRLYTKFCYQIAGCYLDHSPVIKGKEPKNKGAGYLRFISLYKDIFSEDPVNDVWPASIIISDPDICELDGPCTHHPVPCSNRPDDNNCANCTGTDPDEDGDEDEDDDTDTDGNTETENNLKKST